MVDFWGCDLSQAVEIWDSDRSNPVNLYDASINPVLFVIISMLHTDGLAPITSLRVTSDVPDLQ